MEASIIPHIPKGNKVPDSFTYEKPIYIPGRLYSLHCTAAFHTLPIYMYLLGYLGPFSYKGTTSL
jgi:hypothetical protein